MTTLPRTGNLRTDQDPLPQIADQPVGFAPVDALPVGRSVGSVASSPHVYTHVLNGSPRDELATAASTWDITDIVISSHGRTGLPRVIVGSVADALIHRLELPIIVVPALATESVNQGTSYAEQTETGGGST